MQMKKTGIKIAAFFMIALFAASFSGCLRKIDVSRLVEDPTEFEAPEILEVEDKNYPGEVEDHLKGAYIDVYPVFGDSVHITGMEYVIQQIIDAYGDPGRIIDEEPSKLGYKNLIKIYNRQDQLLGRFEISSEFLLYARTDKNSSLFLLPEYAYYTIEYALWLRGASLVEPLEDWERLPPLGDERATYKEEMLDLRLAHDIKTVLVQKYGVSEAYFLYHHIYTTAEYASSDLLTVRVYALVGYAGYSMKEEEKTVEQKEKEAKMENPPESKILFSQDYHVEKAARIIYTFVDGKYYRMTDYDEEADYNEELPSSRESRIRAIFPYEYMKEVAAALEDISNIDLDRHRQALDYLRKSGPGGY